ncbi:general transcription and DNA repair factor IIH subunit TFB4 isoform X2 [Nymphaea colorata]|uniref:general transcription and DNA repair factor IIH subunit TFB4 isoform X2 n=1 Tax=Nymphaea colorata TaxID=210225 RepID=UPI00129D9057|nr:general transcription and DNA repair factor IIH subunit TFB4 isoform X2 [Nymphaea colorata]
MESISTKLYTDDVSLLMVLIDTNPYFWSSIPTQVSSADAGGGNPPSSAASNNSAFSLFLSHVLPFLNSILLLNQLNQVVVIATGVNSCDYIFDSSSASETGAANVKQPGKSANPLPLNSSTILQRLESFIVEDRQLAKSDAAVASGKVHSLVSGSLSLALCYIQRLFRSGPIHPQPRAAPDGPEQYVAVMNAIFSAQRSMVPIDSCVIGSQHSAFLQQASFMTGGVYLKPQLSGLFQYLTMVFATDLHSRRFLQLPKPVGVDFRASCFCHKKTINMGYVCSVCLSIFCKSHKKCSTCGSAFNQGNSDQSQISDKKRKSSDS